MIINPTINSALLNIHQGLFPRRQKSWDASYIDKTRKTSNEINLLLDPNVLKDTSIQALLLIVLAILRRHTSNENENEN
ncbi:unnamed protein product [Rotaria sordida]|uniref:Uncharacterized protein n=2 Tax=Rotaria sordida TaxID=392033 RepID=A0A820ER54_9BILA|nr:unnamed protein product [Rotaria sordida]